MRFVAMKLCTPPYVSAEKRFRLDIYRSYGIETQQFVISGCLRDVKINISNKTMRTCDVRGCMLLVALTLDEMSPDMVAVTFGQCLNIESKTKGLTCCITLKQMRDDGQLALGIFC